MIIIIITVLWCAKETTAVRLAEWVSDYDYHSVGASSENLLVWLLCTGPRNEITKHKFSFHFNIRISFKILFHPREIGPHSVISTVYAPVESHRKHSHLHNLFSETFCFATISMRYIRFSIFCTFNTLARNRHSWQWRTRRREWARETRAYNIYALVIP